MTVGSKVKQTIASLKGIKGTLDVYTLQTQDEESSNIFKEAAEVIHEVQKDLEQRLQTLEYEEPQYKGF